MEDPLLDRSVRWPFAIALIAVFLACAPTASAEFVDHAALVADPAARVRLPGAVVLTHVSAESAKTIDGPQPAFDGDILGTQLSAEQVRTFYGGELVRLGWKPNAYAGLASTTDLVAWGWCKDRMDYRVAVVDQTRAFKPEFYKGQTFTTVIHAAIVSRGPTPCALSTPLPSP
jgi:hypothetical protein